MSRPPPPRPAAHRKEQQRLRRHSPAGYGAGRWEQHRHVCTLFIESLTQQPSQSHCCLSPSALTKGGHLTAAVLAFSSNRFAGGSTLLLRQQTQGLGPAYTQLTDTRHTNQQPLLTPGSHAGLGRRRLKYLHIGATPCKAHCPWKLSSVGPCRDCCLREVHTRAGQAYRGPSRHPVT